MSSIKEHQILHHAVYEPGSEMWNTVISAFRLPLPFTNPPLIYAVLVNGNIAGAEFKHFSIESLVIGHRKDDGTWWSLYEDIQVPSGISLSLRVFYHDELPTKENTKLQTLELPEGLVIEELRLGYTHRTWMRIEGISTVDPERRIEVVSRILPGMKLFHPDTRDAILRSTGGDTRSPEIRQLWADKEVLKSLARLAEQRLPAWKWIKTNVDSSVLMSPDRQQEWIDDMWGRDEVKIYAARYPRFTKELLRRAVDPDLNKADREPTSLAAWHAALEYDLDVNGESLGLLNAYSKYEGKKPAPSTVRGWYDKGAILLNEP